MEQNIQKSTCRSKSKKNVNKRQPRNTLVLNAISLWYNHMTIRYYKRINV